MAHAVIFVRKNGIPLPRAYALKRSFPATNIAFLIAARVEPYSTGTSLPHQPRRICQMPSALGIPLWDIIEKPVCPAPRSTNAFQVLNCLGTNSANDVPYPPQRT